MKSWLLLYRYEISGVFIRNVNLITTWIINNRVITLLIGGFSIADGYLDNTMGDELKQPTRLLESNRVGSTNNHTRLSAGNYLR